MLRQTGGEVQRATAHLHSFVIPKRRQNVLRHKVTAESPAEGFCLHIEKKRRSGGKRPLERYQLETSIM